MSTRVRLLLGQDSDEADASRESACQQIGAGHDISLDVLRMTQVEQLFNELRKPCPADVLLVDPGTGGDISVGDYRAALATVANSARVIELRDANELAREGGLGPVLPPGITQGFIAGFGHRGWRLAVRSLIAAGRHANAITQKTARRKVIQVLNGPNLNLLGTREPSIYGSDTLDDIATRCQRIAASAGATLSFHQSNHEGQLVDWVQDAMGKTDTLIINAAAYTHTSVALHDALRSFDGTRIELHISNPHAREAFRHRSYVSTAVDAVVAGLGPIGYDATIAEVVDTEISPS